MPCPDGAGEKKLIRNVNNLLNYIYQELKIKEPKLFRFMRIPYNICRMHSCHKITIV